MNKPLIAAHIIDAIRSGLAQSILREVVCIDFDWFANPCLTGILKITNQLFMFRINADDRKVVLNKSLLLSRNIAKLTITVRMGRTGEAFAIGFQAQSSFFKSRITVTCEMS